MSRKGRPQKVGTKFSSFGYFGVQLIGIRCAWVVRIKAAAVFANILSQEGFLLKRYFLLDSFLDLICSGFIFFTSLAVLDLFT